MMNIKKRSTVFWLSYTEISIAGSGHAEAFIYGYSFVGALSP